MSRAVIRCETEADYAAVEDMTRRAFYNVYIPGCMEHYLVHTLRSHEDFIPELDLVAEVDGRVIASVMYTRSTLTDEAGNRKDILTFGPLCVDPAHQRQGHGKALLERSFEIARGMGYDTVVIFGSPANYVGRGFVCCKKHNVCVEGGKFPTAMLVKELVPGALDGRRWVYADSPAIAVSEEDAQRYDDALPPMEKKVLPSQEEFFILSHSFVE